MQPKLIIFCAFTRRWNIEQWLEDLAATDLDPSQTSLAVIIDCQEYFILNEIKKHVEQRGYHKFIYKMNEDWHPNEVQLKIRRQRVADVKNQSKDLISQCEGDIVIGLEDDTVFSRLGSFKRLWQPLVDDSELGFIEGVQMGRWGANMIGAWYVRRNFRGLPEAVNTLLPPKDGFVGTQQISGGGFYGYATRRDLYLNHDYYTSTSQPWGPDVNFGMYVQERGFKCIIDWGIVYGHSDHNIIGWPDNPPQGKLVEIIYNRDSLTGYWKRTDHEQTRY